MAALGQFFLGTPGKIEQLPRFSPEQLNVLQFLLQHGMQGLQNPYQGFEPIAQQARTQFQEQTVPSLAERFTSLGGATSSPSFAAQLGQAGGNLETGLAALQSQYGMQNRAQLANLLGMGLTPQFENFPVAAQPGFLQAGLPALGRLAASGIGSLFGA